MYKQLMLKKMQIFKRQHTENKKKMIKMLKKEVDVNIFVSLTKTVVHG